MYGGLGDTQSFGLHELRNILHPLWRGIFLRAGRSGYRQAFGLNDNSHRLLLRWGVSREFSGFRGDGEPLVRRPSMKTNIAPVVSLRSWR